MKMDTLGAGIAPTVREQFATLNNIVNLPWIAGTWFYVDPTSGNNSSDGKTQDTAFADISTAYAACTTGYGDGIVLISRGSSSANTTSYLTQKITWAKNGITVIGIAAPTGIGSRARIASKEVTTGSITTISFTADHTISDSAGGFLTAGFAAGQTIYVNTTSNTNDGVYTISTVTATTITTTAGSSHVSTESAATAGATVIVTYNAENILLSGANNTFYNVQIWNAGSYAGALGGVNITGVRNAFINCHIAGGTGCAATANERSVELGDGAQENVFRDCVIGADTIDRGNNANCELYINGTVANTARNAFYNCEFTAMAGTGTAHLAIKSAAATSMGRHMIFRDCDFICYVPNLGPNMASMFGGTAFNTAKIGLMGSCSALGYAAWDSVGGNDVVYTCGGAASNASHGLPVAP